ncbi:MAG: peptide chain release factor N(5)-glutamine methyltransferase [Planctomycetes bacterium]|nr:peptide chain release factor N(5)-glutamine methyltransferase [Planctomycetota bacterium]
MKMRLDMQEQRVTSDSGEWTISRLIEWTINHLAEADIDAPRLAAELLLAHAIGCQRIELYTRFDAAPSAEELSTFRANVIRAAKHHPIAYLIGKKEFYSLEFEVTPAVLIPRPATEVLVEHVIGYCKPLERERIDILDLGTGSGCIGVTLCRHLENAFVVGSDISEEALEVAGRNAEKLGLQERFRTVRADGFDLPADVVPTNGFDVLASNPPYVASADAESLEPAVRDHEPHIALFGDRDGLEFFRRIAASAGKILAPAGSIFVEIGYDQHDRVIEIMTAGGYRHVESWRDYDTGHQRVIHFDRTE